VHVREIESAVLAEIPGYMTRRDGPPLAGFSLASPGSVRAVHFVQARGEAGIVAIPAPGRNRGRMTTSTVRQRVDHRSAEAGLSAFHTRGRVGPSGPAEAFTVCFQVIFEARWESSARVAS
jgi:hypothetical protein